MSIQTASLSSLAAASRAALLPFLYPPASRCGISMVAKSAPPRRFAHGLSSSSLRPSSSRHALCSAKVATNSSPRWLSTSAAGLSPASSAKTESQTAAYASTSASASHPPFASSSSASPTRPSQTDKTETASVDPACATLSPSSPASPKSQKDPRVAAASASEQAASTPSPATPAPSAADPASASDLTPAKAAELAKDPKVAATMPEASAAAGSAPTAPASAPAPAKKVSADRGTKFRSRTAALKLTPTAVLRLRALMESESGPKLIRVGVRNKGCAGMSYHLEYINPQEAGRFDERVKQDGVEVLIDSKALFSIIGSEMDWQEDRLSAKFVFNNPNVKEACGCGESFLT